jgi:subtilase family protein
VKRSSLRHSSLGVLALAGVVAASSAQSPLLRPTAQAQRESPVPGVAHLLAFGSRSPAQQRSASASKLDGALADLVRHAHLARPGQALADLHALNPAARFMQAVDGVPMVAVDVITRGDPQRLKEALVALGLQHASMYANDVGGWLPVSAIEAAAALAEVHTMRAAMSRTRAGKITSQGDFAQGTSTLRTTFPTLTGSGVTVGILSDSYDCYAVYAASGTPRASGLNGYARNGFLADAAADAASGDLSSSVNVLKEAPCASYGAPYLLPFGDEGRAMLQVVHDVAPGARLAFHTASVTAADFASGITALAAAGAKVIADDVGYFDEPFFQDGIVAQAIDAVAAQGVAYFSAAGNDGTLAYDNTAPSFSIPSASAPNAGEMLLNFAPTGMTANPSLPLTIPAGLIPGEFIALLVEWDQPYVTGAPASGGATSRIDLCVTGVSGTDTIIEPNGTVTTGPTPTCTGANATGMDPVQVLIIGNPANASGNSAQETLNVQIGLASASPAPGRIKVAVQANGAPVTINSFYSPSPTLQGHPGAAGAAAVGAAHFQQTPRCGTTPAVLASYSSQGGSPILFDATGARLATAVVRPKPDFVGPDGVNNTFLGFVLSSLGSGLAECQNNLSFPSFFGTSAATPHAAGVAALMLQSNPSVTPAQIYAALRTSAAAMAATPPDFLSGYGFIQADAALALQAPTAPALTLGAASIVAGGSTSLTWSGINVTACTASGSWSGAKAVGSTITVMPATAGDYTYTLTCNNAQGSAAASAKLTVTAAPPSSGGGGGGFDVEVLLALAGLAGARLLRRRATLQ